MMSVNFENKDGTNVIKKDIRMFLPPEIFAALYHTDRDLFFQYFGSDEDRVRYWTTFREPW